MTHSDPKKLFKQLEKKPAKLQKYKKHNLSKERSCGKANTKCSRCGRITGHINKYGLDLCRQCFREIASDIGFKKYN